MTMIKRGSQIREVIEDTDMVFLRFAPDDQGRVLRDSMNPDTFELWYPRDDHSGYVIVIAGLGHEFVRSLSEAEVLEMP
jgi:hypothetical protein